MASFTVLAVGRELSKEPGGGGDKEDVVVVMELDGFALRFPLLFGLAFDFAFTAFAFGLGFTAFDFGLGLGLGTEGLFLAILIMSLC